MNAEIESSGALIVTAKSELEKYALRQWIKENVKDNKISLDSVLFVFGETESGQATTFIHVKHKQGELRNG